MLNAYERGNIVEVLATFTVGGVATDPTVVTLTVIKGDAAPVDYVYGIDPEVIKLDTGKYQGLIEIDGDGPAFWQYRMEGTAPAEGAKRGEFRVKGAFGV